MFENAAELGFEAVQEDSSGSRAKRGEDCRELIVAGTVSRR